MTIFGKKRKGITLTEMMVYVGVLSIALVAFSRYLVVFTKSSKKSEHQMLAHAGLRKSLMKIESDLYEANEFEFVSGTSITFRCDMVKNPSYNINVDFDGDGIENIKDTDDDNDAQTKFSLPVDQQWRVGYDLEDDDDDNDGNADVRIRIYYSSKTLYREISVNGQTPTVSEIATNISSWTLTFYGSKREDLGRNIDLGNDGVAGTSDAGEGDGIISEREIDWVQSPTGHGNRSGSLNTTDEMKYITSIGMYLESDVNSDGVCDARLNTEIMPPLLPLKRRR